MCRLIKLTTRSMSGVFVNQSTQGKDMLSCAMIRNDKVNLRTVQNNYVDRVDCRIFQSVIEYSGE